MPSLLSPAFPPWGRRTGFRVPHSLVIERSRRGLSAPVSLMEVAINNLENALYIGYCLCLEIY